MKLNSIFAYLIGFIALVLSLLIYMQYVFMLGFPDGFITELEYAQRQLAYVFMLVNIILAFCFIYLGYLASKKNVGKKLLAITITYLICVTVMYCINYYYQLNLRDGRGG